jgi:hypothetical protein
VRCLFAQHKLALVLREYRLLHAGQGRGQLPHNKLIFPATLRYLPIWTLGGAPSAAAVLPSHPITPPAGAKFILGSC